MKNVLLIFSVLAVTSCLYACTSDDDSNSGQNIILPVGIEDGAITVFFNTELPEMHHSSDGYRTSKSFFYNPTTYGGMAIEENMIFLINSRKELADIYLGEKELPNIDFDRYTLIIGQQMMPYWGFYIVKKELEANDKGLKLTLYARNEGEVFRTAIQHLYFWNLYPKLSEKTIIVNVIKEYLNRQDLQ